MSYLFTIRKRGHGKISLQELRRIAARDPSLSVASPVTVGALGVVVHISWLPPGGTAPAILSLQRGAVVVFRPCSQTQRKMRWLAGLLSAEIFDDRNVRLEQPTRLENARAFLWGLRQTMRRL